MSLGQILYLKRTLDRMATIIADNGVTLNEAQRNSYCKSIKILEKEERKNGTNRKG